MITVPSSYFAQTQAPDSGIGAFNINLKSFLFQLITFVIVLLVIKRWVLPPVQKTLEERRQTLEKSLIQAKETEEALARAEVKAEEILARARIPADESLRSAKKTAEEVITGAESAAAKRGQLIIQEAQAQLAQEKNNLRLELREELAELVADTAEKIIRQKLNVSSDRSLIERTLQEVK